MFTRFSVFMCLIGSEKKDTTLSEFCLVVRAAQPGKVFFGLFALKDRIETQM